MCTETSVEIPEPTFVFHGFGNLDPTCCCEPSTGLATAARGVVQTLRDLGATFDAEKREPTIVPAFVHGHEHEHGDIRHVSGVTATSFRLPGFFMTDSESADLSRNPYTPMSSLGTSATGIEVKKNADGSVLVTTDIYPGSRLVDLDTPQVAKYTFCTHFSPEAFTELMRAFGLRGPNDDFPLVNDCLLKRLAVTTWRINPDGTVSARQPDTHLSVCQSMKDKTRTLTLTLSFNLVKDGDLCVLQTEFDRFHEALKMFDISSVALVSRHPVREVPVVTLKSTGRGNVAKLVAMVRPVPTNKWDQLLESETVSTFTPDETKHIFTVLITKADDRECYEFFSCDETVVTLALTKTTLASLLPTTPAIVVAAPLSFLA